MPVTVSVALDDATHRVVATVDYGQDKDAAAFDDLYVAAGSAVLSVAKTVNGEAPAEGQAFDFGLSTKTEGAPMPERDAATTDGAAAASFGELEFGLEDAGKTYEYAISEPGPALAQARRPEVTTTPGSPACRAPRHAPLIPGEEEDSD